MYEINGQYARRDVVIANTRPFRQNYDYTPRLRFGRLVVMIKYPWRVRRSLREVVRTLFR